MSTPKARLAFTAVMVVIVLVAFLFGGSAITTLAAQSALPGDALYPVKTTIEQTRLSLARSAAVRSQLQIEFAERRLGEIEALIAERRYQQVSSATLEYESYIKNALAELGLISEMDPVRATELMLAITQSLSRYARTLTAMMGNVPDPVRAEMQRSIESIQGVSIQENLLGETEFSGIVESMNGDLWVIAGQTVRVNQQTELKGQIQIQDTVRVHAFQDVDGVLQAREIELLGAGNDNANQNENINGNTNANDNSNGNGNLNQNINANENQNQNLNQNDNTNANSKINTNDNQNDDAVEDDNGNSNTNVNQNGDDDDDGNVNGNTNTNENQNQNDNSDDDEGNSNTNENQNDDNGNSNDNSDSNENQNQNDNGDDDD